MTLNLLISKDGFMIGNEAHKLNGNHRGVAVGRKLNPNEAVNTLSRASIASIVEKCNTRGQILMDHDGKIWANPAFGTKTGYEKAWTKWNLTIIFLISQTRFQIHSSESSGFKHELCRTETAHP